MSDLLAYAKVPAYTCPPGTKMWILNFGTLTIDEGWQVSTILCRKCADLFE
jgi:hypothetical protein